METRDMVRMANQIGDYFKAYGDEAAKKEIAYHINSFWEPRMRKLFFAHVDKGGEGLNAAVLAAVPGIKKPA